VTPRFARPSCPATRKPRVVERTAGVLPGRPGSTIVHLGHWLESIRTRKPYWQDAVQGHHAAACAHMVNLSAKQLRVVEWDFARDDIKT
jgi:hypothetical protein